MAVDQAKLRDLPSVDEVQRRADVLALLRDAPRWAVTAAIRQAIAARRQAIMDGDEDGSQRLLEPPEIERRVEALLRPALLPVINATGVVIHTNLGRSPLPGPALERLTRVAQGYSNLEYRQEEGRRGSRHDHLRKIASELCGAEDAVIVNNNAAAVLLTVSALAAGREVIVSRGELVEIGGGFRIPEVIVQGGARLREGGTTNRTRLDDYQSAIGPETAALLKVHRSNFDVVGFTEEVDIPALAGLARAEKLPLIDDLGSGAMIDPYGPGLTGEPVITKSLAGGADVVCFSGDKLLGGPQAGIILGRSELIADIRKHALTRAVRPCKLTLAALEATLELWRDDRSDEIPTARMLGENPKEARRRALRFSKRVRKTSASWQAEVVSVKGRAGGGSLPLGAAPGWAVALSHADVTAAGIEAALRAGQPPVISRIVDDQVLLDLRTVMASQERTLLTRLEQTAMTLGGAARP